MIPFPTSQVDLDLLPSLIDKMISDGIDPIFIAKIKELASTDQGVFDLVLLYNVLKNAPSEQKEILIDLQLAIDDYKI